MAGRILQSFIDDILARVDIVDIVDARVPLKKTGANYSACCPFHDEKTPSFTVSPDKQFYHCFGCGAHGSAIGFLMEYDHLEFVEAVEDLAHRLGVDVLREEGGAEPQQKRDLSPLFDLNVQADQYFRNQLRQSEAKAAVAYLKDRGITGELAKSFHLGFAPPGWDGLLSELGRDDTERQRLNELGLVVAGDGGKRYDRFRNRIVFPIRNRRGQVIGFGGRVLGDDVPKYLNSPETPLFHKGREVYGLYESVQSRQKIQRFLLVEGYMDVIALHQYGFPYAVAALGTAITAEQLDLLFRSSPELVICLDGDEAGQKAAWRALKNALPLLRSGRSLRFLQIPAGEDPDSLVRREGSEGFEHRIENATPLSSYFFEYLQQQHDTRHAEGRSALVDEARPLLEALPAGSFAKMMVRQLAELARIDPEVQSQRSTGRVQVIGRAATNKSALSPLRRVITLLLNNPALASHVQLPDLVAATDMPGYPLLQAILKVLKDNPQLSSAGLLERFRDSEHAKIVRKLLLEEVLVPPEGELEELNGALQRLREQLHDAALSDLLERARTGPLSPEERETLRRLSSRSP